MQSRMVAAVATTSIQRHAPRKLRTRVTSASCMLPAAPCGSSNTIRLASSCAVVETEADDMIDPARGQLTAENLILEPVRHVGLRKRCGTHLHPAVEECLVIRRRIGFSVVGPRGAKHLLPLDQ